MTDSKTKEKMLNPWSKKNVCEVCNETCVSTEEKKEHEAKKTHSKKFAIKTFLNTYLKSSNSNLPSALARRFRTSKEKAAGLECLHEFRFPWCATGWWACSICYDSGCSLEQAEHHVRSPTHLTAYLEEFDPDKAAAIKKYKHNPIEYYTELNRARDELYETQGEIPPEVFELDMSKEDAMVKLVVANLPNPPKETLTLTLGDDETIKRAIVRCTVCHVVIPCFRKNLNKVWNVHENSPEHRKASAVLGMLNYLNVEEVLDDENEESGALAYHWRRINSTYFGPICGKNHLLTAGKQNYCLLCQCMVNCVEEHFASEFHILRFLCTKKTQDIIRYIHQSPDVRRAKMMDLLSKITMDNDKHKKLDSGSLPEPIMNLRCEEKLDVEEFMFPLTSFGADLCLVCGICKCVIKVEMNDAPLAEGIWNDHVTSTAHFDVLSRQSCYRFYDEFFVPLLPTVKTLPPMLHGEWKNINVDDKISYKIQTQCDVGLEWIVEDQEAGEVVCTLCARTYKKDSIDGINNHIRSYMHLNQYLHYDNRDFLALLMGQPNEKSVLDLMLDWLQRTYAPVNPFYYDIGHMYSTIKSQNWGQIRVYSPEKATNIAKKMTVPHRMTQLPYYLPEFRPAAAALWPVIDQISNDGEDKLVKDLQDALMFSTCRIVWMDDQDNKLSRKWILRCMACQMLIPTTVETLLHDVFDVHLFDDEHDRRLQAYAQLEADRCRFAESTSNHTVKPFVQPNPVKKLSWHFNPDFSKYQYVLSVVGLEDMIERASSQYEPDRPPDFFCKLCALSIPKRHVALEQHVRSRDHIFNYVQKYFPMSIHELDAAKSDPKIERRVLANLVKDVKPSKEYPIPVFDPIGEQKRTQAMLEDEQNAKKKQDSLAVSRQKAEQLRLKREQEKLKILAREKENQDRIKNETLEREKKIRDASDRLKAETERLKEDLAREQKRKIKEEAEKARQFAIIQAEKDKLAKRQRNDHKTVLENELQKLQSLKKREEEKRKKEEFQFITERTNALSNKFQPLTHLAPPMMPHMNAPPPMPMNFSVPPPNFPGIGPKPVFNSFVPTVAAIPVYPMGAEDMDISHGRSRSPSPRKRRRSRSRSRSRERRSRRHSRSPPRRSPLRHGRREISPHKRRSISPIPRQKKNEPAEGRPSLRGRTVDLIIASLCSNRAQLVDYMWRQGAERIPTAEMPVQFSKKACSIEGNVGVDSVFEVVCIDAPELETYYCSICGIWGNPSEMIGHLSNPHHRLAFLLRNHKNIHANIMTEKDSSMRDTLLRAYIEKVWKSEKGDHPTVCHRLTTLLDRATIERVCPEYVVSTPKPVPRQPEPTRIPVPAPVQMDVFGSFASKAAYVPPFPPPTNLPPGFNTHFPPPPGMVPIPSVPILTPPAGSSKTSSRSDMRKRSRSPRGTRRRSRSRERRRSPSPRRRDDSRRSPSSKKRSPREDRDDRRRRSRSRSRSRRSGDRRVTESATASKDNINWASKVEQFIKKTAGSAPPVANFPSAPTRSSEVITRDDAPTPVKDGQALQRKLLGLMCMMQTDVETTGNVDPNKIRQMAADMGINMGDKEPQEAIAALLESTQKHSEKTNFNLAEYGIQPMAQQPVNYPQYHPYQQQPPSMQSYQREDLTLTGILQGIPSSLAKLNQNPRPLSPIIKPMPYHFGKTEEYFKETSMSLVYPNDPEELQRENKEKQERKKQVTEKLRAKIADLQARTDKLQNNDDDDDWDSLENDLGQLIDKKAEAPAAPANTDSPEIIEIRGGPMRMGVPTTWQQPVPQTVKQTATPVQISVPAQEHIPIAPGQKMLLARTILPNGKAIPQPEAAKPIQQQFNPYSAAPTTVSQTAQAPVAYPFQQSQIYNQQAFNPVAFQQPPPFYQPGQYQTPPPQFAPPFQQQTVPLVQPTVMHPPGTDPQQQNYFYQQQYRY